jgi:guanylate kinase
LARRRSRAGSGTAEPGRGARASEDGRRRRPHVAPAWVGLRRVAPRSECGPSYAAGVARVFVITGPSGVGKGTLIRTLRERVPELELSVSATTRAPRPGEQDGVDYHFLQDADFQRRVEANEFVEHAQYSGRRYGTLRAELERRTAAGHPVVLEIEVQGARQVRTTLPEAIQVFIAPPSLDALRTRLVGRGTDDEEQVAARLQVAEEELAAQDEFGHVVVNDRLDDAVEELVAIVRSALEHCVKTA